MPMVPETFAPSVSQGETPLTPATGPWVSPMRNSAPSLLSQTGQTLSQAGDTMARLGNTIADRVQDTVNEAQTKAAENQFLQQALPALGQYKATEGDNATQQFNPTAQAILKARDDARSKLSNPMQQQMFDMAANGHVLNFTQQMNGHENEQRVRFGLDQAAARAKNMNTLAAQDVPGRNRPDSDYAKYGALADNETLEYARLKGIDPASPMAEEMLRQNRTDRVRSVISALHDNHAYSEEQDFFDQEKGNIDLRTAELLGNMVKSDSTLVQGTDMGNQAVQALQKTKGAGPLQPPMPAATISTTSLPGVNGIDLHAPAGQDVRAPASGTVTKVWSDAQRGLSADITMPSGYVATLSGLGAVNYKEGQKITGGQVLGLSGADDNGRAVTHYEMQAPDGSYVDPRQAVSAPFDPKNFSAPEDEAKAVGWLNANVTDDVVRRVAVNRVESLANHNREITNQQHAAALKQATDWWFQHGKSINDLPADVKVQLTPEDIDSFSQATKAKNDVHLMANWILNPDQQSVDAVNQAYARGQLSDQGYLRALGQAKAMADDAANPNPDKVRAVTIDNDQVNNTLLQNGFPDLVTPGTDKDLKAQRVKLFTDIKNQIDTAQTMTGRQLTRGDKQQIIDRTISDSAYVDQSHLFGAPTAEAKRVYFMTPKDLQNAYEVVGNQRVYLAEIPAQERQTIMSTLYRRGLPVTEQSIANLWLQAGKPGGKQ